MGLLHALRENWRSQDALFIRSIKTSAIFAKRDSFLSEELLITVWLMLANVLSMMSLLMPMESLFARLAVICSTYRLILSWTPLLVPETPFPTALRVTKNTTIVTNVIISSMDMACVIMSTKWSTNVLSTTH
jgi:hypothetical protein